MSVFRRTYTGRDGKREKTGVFYVEFRDHMDRVQRVPGYRDRAATQELERKLRTLSALRASGSPPDETMRRWTENLPAALRDRLAAVGLITAQQVAALRSLSTLVDAWAEHLGAKGTGEEHVRLVKARALRVINGAGAKFWTDLSPTDVENYLRTARESGKRISARTSNFHLQAARQFIRWAIRTGLAVEDPLRVLEPMNAERDRRRKRRALTADELQHLLDVTARGADRDGMSGPERALLYRLAVETGLRRGELVALVVADLDLETPNEPTVRVRAATAKNGREARLPLRAESVPALAAFVANRQPHCPVFATPKSWRAAECMSADLAAAEIEATDAAGLIVDFHALRTTFATSLARSGASLQVAQRLMRHCTPTLTANVYTVLGRDDERAAVAKLPGAATPKGESATGPQGRATSPNVWQASWQERAGNDAIPCDSVRRSARGAAMFERGRETLELCGVRGETPPVFAPAGADGVLVAPPVFKTGVPGEPR